MTEIPNHDLKAEQSNFSPIFVVGCSRSGTTLVRQLLNAHSQIAIAPETWFVKRIWYQFKDVEESSRATLIDYVLNLDVFRDMNLDTIEYRKRAMHKENFVARDAFKLMLEMYGELHEATELGEKTPNHLMHMDELPIALS